MVKIRKWTDEDLQILAKSKNWILIPEKYIKTGQKYKITCSFGHSFEMSYDNIKKRGCAKCSKKAKPTLEEIQILVNSKGWVLISDKYKNAYTKLEVMCEKGHYFKISWSKLKNRGCKICSKKAKPTLEERQKLIESKGGILITINYTNKYTDLKIQCKVGHYFNTDWHRIKNSKTWCPDCNIPLSELICKYIIEQIFKKSFIKIRPDFLKNSKTGYNLEIDLYNEELNIGLEHQGRHHYEDNVYSKTSNLQYTQRNDQLKIELTKKHGCKLIVIPELFKQTKIKDLQDFIISECKKQNIQLPDTIFKIKIDINKIIRDWYIK